MLYIYLSLGEIIFCSQKINKNSEYSLDVPKLTGIDITEYPKGPFSPPHSQVQACCLLMEQLYVDIYFLINK